MTARLPSALVAVVFGAVLASAPAFAPGKRNAPVIFKGASDPAVFEPHAVVDVGMIRVVRDDDNDTVPNQFELDYSYDSPPGEDPIYLQSALSEEATLQDAKFGYSTLETATRASACGM